MLFFIRVALVMVSLHSNETKTAYLKDREANIAGVQEDCQEMTLERQEEVT